MATTRIISMHVSHGKTIADCLTDRIDYSKNPDCGWRAQRRASSSCSRRADRLMREIRPSWHPP